VARGEGRVRGMKREASGDVPGKGRTTVDLARDEYGWHSDVYWVEEYAGRLVIGRHDGAKVDAWYDIWSIKNAVWGDDALAVEIFPPRALLVDGQNQRHLWLVLGDTLDVWACARRHAGRMGLC
jgi:hypothetical protein